MVFLFLVPIRISFWTGYYIVLRMRSSIFMGQEFLIDTVQVVIGFIKLVKAIRYAYKASETLWFE